MEIVDGSHREAQTAADQVEAELDEGIRQCRAAYPLPGQDAALLIPEEEWGDEGDPTHPHNIANGVSERLRQRIELVDKAAHTDPRNPGEFGCSENVLAARKVRGLDLHNRMVSVTSKQVFEDSDIIEFASLLGISVTSLNLNASLLYRCEYAPVLLLVVACAVAVVRQYRGSLSCCSGPI